MAEPTNRYRPQSVSPPGGTLADVLAERGMTQSELAERTGLAAKTVNEIIKGKAPISAETALRLERVLDLPADFWMTREQHYREFLARREAGAQLESFVPWLRELPVNDLIKKGWVPGAGSPVERVRALLGFFAVASPAQWREVYAAPQARFRRSPAFEAEAGAVAAWLRAGEIAAAKLRCAPFSEERFRGALAEARSLTRDPCGVARARLQELCAGVGVALVFVPEVLGCRACGVTRWLAPEKALIQLSRRYGTDDHLWFTFFHEAGHLLLHKKKEVFLESEGAASEAPEELQADRFARDLLIPPERCADLQALADDGPTEAKIAWLAQALGIAPGIVVGRLQHDRLVPFSRFNGLKRRISFEPDAPPGPAGKAEP